MQRRKIIFRVPISSRLKHLSVNAVERWSMLRCYEMLQFDRRALGTMGIEEELWELELRDPPCWIFRSVILFDF